MQTFLLVPTGMGVGMTSACLGLMRAYDSIGRRVRFFHPFIQQETSDLPHHQDQASTIIAQVFGGQPLPAIDQNHVEKMLGDGNLDELLEEVIALYQQVAKDADVVIVEGVAPSSHSSYATELNVILAQALDAKVILISSADLAEPEALADRLDMCARPFGGVESERTAGVILMRVTGLDTHLTEHDSAYGDPQYATVTQAIITQLNKFSPLLGTETFPIMGVVPYRSSLLRPRMLEVAQAVKGTWLNQGEASTRRVESSVLCARTVSNLIHVFQPNTLVVVPGDRDDVLIAAALSTMNGMSLAGVLLTGGFKPSQQIVDLCLPAIRTGLPILSVEDDSFTTVTRLNKMSKELPIDDHERAELVTQFVSNRIDLALLEKYCAIDRIQHLSPSAFRYALVQKAQHVKRKIVLPEGAEPRTVQASIICQNRGIADCILLAKYEEVAQVAKNFGVKIPTDLKIIDPDSIREQYIEPMVERRKGKLNATTAEAQLMDNVVLGTMMLYLGHVDGLVSGAIHTTANTVRPAFQLIKTAPAFSLVSSVFFMLLPEQVVVYGDCAINPDPNAEELAEIAIQSADTASAFGIEPRVAMISYSTGDSGEGTDVEKVREATKIAQARRPDLMIDGPLQYDAASIESVGKQKAPNSLVAGRATVFIFPDLNTGNTTYKAVQRSANVLSVGPLLQGLNKPVNDLSRGALVDDIVYTIALTAIQAGEPYVS